MPTISIAIRRYENLCKSRTLFLAKRAITRRDYEHHKDIIDYQWYSTDKSIKAFIDATNFGDLTKDCILIVIDDDVEHTMVNSIQNPSKYNDQKNYDEYADDSFVSVNIHEASPNDLNDWICIINNSANHLYDNSCEYGNAEIIWFLSNKEWESDLFIKALSLYNSTFITSFTNILSNIASYFSISVQQRLQVVLAHFNIQIQPYLPGLIYEAYCNIINEQPLITQSVFDLVDRIIRQDDNQFKEFSILQNDPQNPFVRLVKWLYNGQFNLLDYSFLENIYSYVDTNTQLDIIRRYFFDVKEGRTIFSKDIIEKFKDNKYRFIGVYRYCMKNPIEKIDLAPVLLCDCVLTAIKSGGTRFQDYGGILDTLIQHINPNNPNVDFGLHKFLPSCDGGTVVNLDGFKGFIDYDILYAFNDKELCNKETLLETARKLLDKLGMREQITICTHYDKILNDTERRKCKALYTNKEGYSIMCDNSKKMYSGFWFVSKTEEKTEKLSKFMDVPEPVNGRYKVSLEMVSEHKLASYIKDLILSISIKQTDDLILIPNYSIHQNFISQYLIRKKMRIIPRTTSYIGKYYDVFGIVSKSKQDGVTLDDDEFKELESQEVTKRVIESLEKKLEQKFYGFCFEIDYDSIKLDSLLKEYYYHGIVFHEDEETAYQFLTRGHHPAFLPLCSPYLSKANNPATDIPYFWCVGKECFHNVLDNQVLSKTTGWGNYSLLHILEILGYKKIKEKQVGENKVYYEPDESVRIFIASANKAIKKFNRLKCRVCGHLLFSTDKHHFGSYSHYKCLNPHCSEFNKDIYLSYCFKCKKGLIDSRDTAACPNGMYVCPTCLSCCDDDLYERLAQKYILQHWPIPPRLQEKRGHGHNDKGIYFCPTCGNQLTIYTDAEGKKCRKCDKCNKIVEIKENYTYNINGKSDY